MPDEKAPDPGDEVKKLVGWYGQISRLFDYLEGRYPIRQAIGLFLLILVALVTAGFAVAGHMNWEHILVAVVLAAALILLSVSIARDQFARLERRGLDTFGRLSLLERTEEDRREVAGVAAITSFLEISRAEYYDFASFFRDLGLLMDAPELVAFRGELDRHLRTYKGRWRPSYLEHYVRALKGISHLMEGQDPAKGRVAHEPIDAAQQALEREHPDAQVSAILNARAICNALRADDKPDFAARIPLMFEALKDFARAGQMASGNPPGMYRFRVNYAEWCTRTFGEWDQAPAHRTELEVRLVATFAVVNASFPELFPRSVGSAALDQALPLLFESAARAVAEADALAGQAAMGRGRAVVHLVAFYLGVAAHAWQRGGGPAPSAALRAAVLSLDALDRRLDQLFRLWGGQMSADDIRKTVHGLPRLDHWLEAWPEAVERFGDRLGGFAPPAPSAAPAPPAALATV
jgi:hypothetical protein